MKYALQGLALEPKVLTFDVYGTLIDWETGLNTAFTKYISNSWY